MAYLFPAGAVTDKIDCGTGVTNGGVNMSLAIRFRPTAANTTIRYLVQLTDSTDWNFLLQFGSAGTNVVSWGFTTGAATPAVSWTTGFGAGELHTLVGTYDGANLLLYADTDSTAKATLAETRTPDTGTLTFVIGNRPATNNCAASTIYEVAFWPTVTLTGTQAAFFGGGYDAAYLFAPFHWRLLTTPNARRGGQHGAITGLTRVTHDARILYPPELWREAA